VLNDLLASDVRRNGMHSSGTDDDRMLRAHNLNETETKLKQNSFKTVFKLFRFSQNKTPGRETF